MSKKSRFSKRLKALVLLFCLGASPFTPPAATPAAHAFTIGEEREIGEKLLTIVRKEFKLLDDPDISEYISSLGRETLKLAGPQFFDYHFFVINNKEFNAFAAPSGLIFVHSGLIDICGSEGELLSVIAHEVGHAASRHIADRINKSSKLNAGTTALMLAGLLIGQGALSEAIVAGSMAAGTTANLKFSRQDEEEADRLAYKWMVEQQRDPEEMVHMLNKMRRVSRYRQGKLPTYLLTHPAPENRVGYIEDKILLDPGRKFVEHDPFYFERIKYKVQVLTKDIPSLLPILEKMAAEPEAETDNIMVFYGLSQAYLKNRQFDKAEEALAKVRSRYPDRHILLTDLGRIYLESGEREKALGIFTSVNKEFPQDTYNTYYLAQALQQTGDLKKAVIIFEHLANVLPTHSSLYYDIGRIRASLGEKGVGHYYMGLFHYYEGSSKNANYHLAQAMKELKQSDPYYAKAKELQEKLTKLDKM